MGTQLLGGIAALASANFWALSTILLQKVSKEITPLGLNLTKCAIGTLLLAPILLLTSTDPVDLQTLVILSIS